MPTLRILLVEDNPVKQRVAARFLEQMGYRCDTAANGIEALAALARQPYDTVLMDVQMSDMDSLETTREIHRLNLPELRPHLIALTAHASNADRQACADAGMDDYLTKPLSQWSWSRNCGMPPPIWPSAGPAGRNLCRHPPNSRHKRLKTGP